MGAFSINERSTAGESMQQGANAVAKALQRWEDDRKKQKFNEGLFDTLAGQTDSDGKPYVPVEAIARWHSMDPDKQAGVLSLAMSNYKQDQEGKLNDLQKAQAAMYNAEAANYNAKAANGGSPLAYGPGYTPDETTVAQMGEQGYAWAPSGGKLGGKWVAKKSSDVKKAIGEKEVDAAGNVVGIWSGDPNKPHLTKITPPDPFKKGLADMAFGSNSASQPGAMSASVEPNALPGAAKPSPTAPAPAATPVRVNTPEEAQALPSGTLFLTPDGRLKRRP